MMAWWDHEELKAPEDRSDRYKRTFPGEYASASSPDAVALTERVRDAREAAYVTRCHTKPHIGTYQTGWHSYNMVSMLLILHPSPSLALIKAVQFHDTGERWVGDTPYSAKCGHQDLGVAYGIAEEEELEAHGFPPIFLTPEEKAWLSALDLIEFWMWALDQQKLGNQVYKADIRKCDRIIKDQWETFPPPLQLILRDWKNITEEWTNG